MSRTCILIVIDALGIDTLEFLIERYNSKVNIPTLFSLGIKDLIKKELLNKINKNKKTYPSKAILVEQLSKTADSLIGHREMMGLIDNNTYNLFPNGFPKEYLKELERLVGRKTFFNKMAGGMEAIEQNYSHHEKTGDLIVYASKCDPLIQIAMNEEIIPLSEQKFIADTSFNLARKMNINITRAIARSYIRKNGEIIRTPNRYDAVLPLSAKTLIDILNEKKVWTVSVGKTSDLVNTKYYEKIKLTNKEFIDPKLKLKFIHPAQKDTNPFNIQGTINAIKSSKIIYRPNGTFIFSNFVDTDSLWGHTRDIKGAIKSIEEVDKSILKIINILDNDDLLIITTDHGMEHKDDYGYHSKERLFGLIYQKKNKIYYPKMPGLIGIGDIISKYFKVEKEYKEIVKTQKM